MHRKQKGFTLIELLVVIAIIGLLSTLAVVALTSARAKARDAKRISDVKQVQTSLELHFADSQSYPTGTAALLGTGNQLVLCGKGTGASDTGGFKAALVDCGTTPPTFMGKVPRDPSAPLATPVACTGTSDAVGCDYGYTQTSSGAAYTIWFRLEGDSGELKVGSNCASPNGLKAAACI